MEICKISVLFDRQRVCQAEENNRYCIQYTDSYHLWETLQTGVNGSLWT